MAVLRGGYLRGSLHSGTLGDIVFQGREGQQIVKSKPEPQHLKGVKSMTDEELARWAEIHGMTFEEAKRIREKQSKIKEAIDNCKREKEEDPSEFIEKYKPRKPGETPFNVCVSKKLRE